MAGPHGITRVEIVVPLAPDRCLLPNARRKAGRAYWSQAEATAELRRVAMLAALGKRDTCGGGPLFREPVIVSYRVVWPYARYKRALPIPDPDAVPTACKAILDGLIDAGVLVDDSAASIAEVRGRSERGGEGEQGYVKVTVEEVTA